MDTLLKRIKQPVQVLRILLNRQGRVGSADLGRPGISEFASTWNQALLDSSVLALYFYVYR
jgi:hypothetical protein